MCRNSNIFERNQPYFPLTCTADDRPENVPGKSWMRKNALGCLAWDGVWAWNRVCERAAPVTHCTCWERGTSSSFSSSSRGNPRPGPPDVRWVRIVSHSQALTLCDCSRSRSYSPTSGIFACAKSFSWKPSRGDSVFLLSSFLLRLDSTPLHKSRHTMTKYLQIARRASEEPPLDTNLFSFPDSVQFRSALLYCLLATVVSGLARMLVSLGVGYYCIKFHYSEQNVIKKGLLALWVTEYSFTQHSEILQLAGYDLLTN